MLDPVRHQSSPLPMSWLKIGHDIVHRALRERAIRTFSTPIRGIGVGDFRNKLDALRNTRCSPNIGEMGACGDALVVLRVLALGVIHWLWVSL